jgi:predicted CXXCH cytochrome family protein
MRNRLTTIEGIIAAALLAVASRTDAAPMKTEVKKAAHRRGVDQKPYPKDMQVSSHAPYTSGQCGVCHVNNDKDNPGPIKHASINQECFDCHEDTLALMSRRYKHQTAEEMCTDCHNAHNAPQPGLLAEEMVSLCLKCHAGIKKQLATGKVQHDAVTKDKKCSNCHNPHASNIERLLISLPFDLCVTCHSRDGMVSDDGKQMVNMKKWLEENKVWHDPVKAKDCSACHRTHAGDNYRLLRAEYPSAFYAPYERKLYTACYSCHNDKVVSAEETTTLTGFRDGSKNLHYVHVHRERGRTCRACHEVHASKQDHHIREGVPYGAKGWVLKVGYTKLPNGGSCAKTCHDTKTYNNKTLTSAIPSTK